MTAGISVVNLANKWLDFVRGTSPTAPAAVYMKLHTADPGSAGATAAAAGSTTRVVITWSAAASGAIAMTGTAPSWTNGGTSETLTHVSFWDNLTAGNFLGSGALGSSQAWASGNTFTITTQTWAVAPLAA